MKIKKQKSTKKQQASEILKRLKIKYPVVKCALNFSNNFELLVATILSAQCTDKRVNIVTEKLFKKYKTPKDYALAGQKDFEKDIHSTGFYRNKAKNIIGTAKIISEKYHGKVPDEMEKLIELPGVARKTANVVLSVGFKKNAGIVVDTHVSRLSNRLNLSKETNAVKIEKDLIKLIPQKEWEEFSLRLIQHGRDTCIARKPKCKECELVDICPASSNYLSKK